MDGGLRLILVDRDTRRRARISHGLIAGGLHVEPFEDIAELIAHWPNSGLILVEDGDGTVAMLIEHMRGSGGWLPLVAFADTPATPQVVAAMQAGALDYLVWPFADGTLTETLATAELRGRAQTAARRREAEARARIEKLSEREREVLAAVAEGLSNDLIARRLGISSRTVEIHRANMLSKLGAGHTSEAIRVAIEGSLLG